MKKDLTSVLLSWDLVENVFRFCPPPGRYIVIPHEDSIRRVETIDPRGTIRW